jgi:sugar phosphate isomerase/epimerase
MKIGVMNHPKQDVLKEIKWISENGFDFIDLTIEPPEAYDINVSKVKKALNDCNLEVIGHTNPFLPAIFPVQSIRQACLDEFRKYIDVFSELGVKLMNVHPFYDAHFFSEKEKVKANIQLLKKLNKLCTEKEITLMLENFIPPFDSPEAFEKICDEVPGLAVHLDVGHCNLGSGRDLTESFFRKLGNKIIHVHFSDNKGRNDEHLPLGCGSIEWDKIVGIVKNSGYDRTITLEVFSYDRDYLLLSRDKLKRWWAVR